MSTNLEAAFPDVSRETVDRLKIYETLLRKWNPAINLVSPHTLESAVDRHFRDSAQVYGLVSTPWASWADLGAGGGFPGLVVAILAADQDGDRTVSLMESDQRKATFLRTVIRETGISGRVIAERIEAHPPLKSDVVSARALAPLPALLGLAKRHLSDAGIALFHKGADWKKEVEDAKSDWCFDVKSHTSETHPDAVVLEIRDLSHV